MEELEKQQPLLGLELIPLVFHVDYWDRLGWKDPYASAANTQRQYAYARARDEQVYTPQAFVNGGRGFVGHDRSQALAQAQGLRNLALRWRGQTLEIDGLSRTNPLWIALTKDAPKTAVLRGENAGRKLIAKDVVVALFEVPVQGAKATWALSSLHGDHVVAFQQTDLGAIVAAARLAVP